MAKLVDVRLSRNPDSLDVDAKGGINGKASSSKNGKRFVVLEFEDDQNIFKVSRAVRTYWMNGDGEDAKWAGKTPEELLAYKGKTIPGKFVTANVFPYEITGDDGKTREIGTYTTFVMPHESADTVISKAGHDVLNEDGSVRVAKVDAGQPNAVAQ